MAEYDPAQPLWKRGVAGILDFVLAFAVFAPPATRIFGAGQLPAFITQNPNMRFVVSMSGTALAVTIILTIGYFAVLGGTGGTVFQRLFGMKRATPDDEVREVVKTIVRPDEKRRVQIYQRHDGLFSFREERRLWSGDGKSRWSPFAPSTATSHSPEDSERQARSAIGWLGLMP